jgi:hypothetical protein
LDYGNNLKAKDLALFLLPEKLYPDNILYLEVFGKAKYHRYKIKIKWKKNQCMIIYSQLLKYNLRMEIFVFAIQEPKTILILYQRSFHLLKYF